MAVLSITDNGWHAPRGQADKSVAGLLELL
jgi:hypothetical protein